MEQIGNEIRSMKESKAGKSDIKKAVEKLGVAKSKVSELSAVPNKVGGLPQTESHEIDYSRDFFGSPAFLTVSGQLQAEIFACSMVSGSLAPAHSSHRLLVQRVHLRTNLPRRGLSYLQASGRVLDD